MNSTYHQHRPGDGHIRNYPSQSISKLVPYSAIILSTILILYSLLRIYVLEGRLFQRLYGITYSRLSEINRRGFLNHHIAGTTKLLILILGAYPLLSVVFRREDFHSPYIEGSGVTMGDVLIVSAQMLIGMYTFELIYRIKVSPVGVLHHVCTIAIGQVAIAINLTWEAETDRTVEFLLCSVWGAFDLIAEFFPHLTIILYRVYPTRHSFLAKIFIVAAFSTLIGTILETITAMYFFGSCWNKWDLGFKILTPILHTAFSAAQLHGSLVLLRMSFKEKRLLNDKNKESSDPGSDSIGDCEAAIYPGKQLRPGLTMQETKVISFNRANCC